jgi:asparagine synthase (glutamine-hydrolysing)
VSGFVGLVADDAPIDKALLGRLTAVIERCGPDGSATWADGSAGLSHALLAIGEGAAAQPLTLDGRVWLAADARIDGTAEPDAEAILRAYERWGARCPEHLIGDFAFAIWDAPRRRLFCARDHFGIVPLYYARPRSGGLVVGNVLRSLLAHPELGDALDERAVGDFLLFRHNRDLGGTIYADVHRSHRRPGAGRGGGRVG